MKRIITFFSLGLVLVSNPVAVLALTTEAYLYQQQLVSPGPLPDAAVDQLNQQVELIISQSSRLQPYYQDIGIMDDYLLMGYPGEELLTLCDALPFVADNRQAAVKNYIRNQMAQYPPHSYSHFPSTWGTISINQGNRREYHGLHTRSVNIWPEVTVPVGSLYVVWKCAHASDNQTYISQNWTSLRSVFSSFANSSSQQIHTYQELLGVIGFVRLAHWYNQNGGSETTLLNTATNMVTNAHSRLTNMPTTLATSLSRFQTNSSHDWTFPLFHHSRTNRAIVALYGPELGRYLKEEAGADTFNMMEQLFSYIPVWHLTKAHYPTVGEADGSGTNIWDGKDIAWLVGTGYSENNLLTPDIVWTFSMIRSAIYDDTLEEALALVDVPYMAKGDIYHIQKLSAALKKGSQICWQDIRTGAQTCESPPPSASPSPTPCQKADINQDGVVDLSDYSTLSLNFLKTSGFTNPRADINGDGVVDLTDYSQLAIQFLKTCQ